MGAVFIRDNLTFSVERLIAISPFIAITLALATLVLVAAGANRSILRLTVMSDYVRLIMMVAVIVGAATVATFLFNRLDGIERSLPILQGILMALGLVGIRVLARQRQIWRRRGKTARGAAVTTVTDVPGERETVLIVGINRVADLYINAVVELADDTISIAGFLARSSRHKGMVVHDHRVWGTTSEIERILPDLAVRGLFVSRIVVTLPREKLSFADREALERVTQAGDVEIEYFADTLRPPRAAAAAQARQAIDELDPDAQIGLAGGPHADRALPAREAMAARVTGDAAEGRRFSTVGAGTDGPEADVEFSIPAMQPRIRARRVTWFLKRVFDATLALTLLVLLSPVILLVALLVAIDNGTSIIFAQTRPGLGGRPFRVFKFITMSEPYNAKGERIPDDQRVSWIGNTVRRFRLDELPQLLNILRGDMSFVGPRPLLPVDQPAPYMARLLVRPGLTGWAQVRGGRELTAADKAALDIWYVHNASLWLDAEIMLRTIPMVLRGERLKLEAVQKAWDDLRNAGICRTARA
ncbi:MAG: sugar transferase [Pseudomonadota bacterium]